MESSLRLFCMVHVRIGYLTGKQTPWLLIRERTIPIDGFRGRRSSADFCEERVLHGDRNESLRPLILVF
jgi:hypothetical protein